MQLAQKENAWDIASFIGFSGLGNSKFWDQAWNLGIARTVNIASLPMQTFTHHSIPLSDVTMVSGLSFAGSSGSVVILHETFKVEPKILGIMSGHWGEPGTAISEMLHSGLSYYTRSTSIIELL